MKTEPNSRRDLLKNLLAGKVSAEKARVMLERITTGPIIMIVVICPDGLYSIGKKTGLTEEEMLFIVEGTPYVIVTPECAKLGDATE